MTTTTTITRRQLLHGSALTGAGLLLAVWLPGCMSGDPDGPDATPTVDTSRPAPDATATATITVQSTPTETSPSATPTEPPASPTPEPEPETFAPSAWLSIAPDNTVTIRIGKVDMGQGLRTALPMIVAEELGADWGTVRVEQASLRPEANMQNTGGSRSVSGAWSGLRVAGAAAREMLIAAAAAEWSVAAEECDVADGAVTHAATGSRLTFGELALAAAELAVPTAPALKDPGQFTLIGTRVANVDLPEIVTGRTIYGSDARAEGMLFAAVARPPRPGATVARFDDAVARSISGVREVVEVNAGVAVVAEHTWAAMRGRDALEIEWSAGDSVGFSTTDLFTTYQDLAETTDVPRTSGSGDVPAALASATTTIAATYELPYLAHATMEPMNATADIRSDRAEVWVPTQYPGSAMRAIMDASALPSDWIDLHITHMGGGFGRRINVDYVAEAAAVSREVGAPVQVVWSREDDMRHDFYRPASLHHMTGGIDAQGLPVAFGHRMVQQTWGGYDPTAGATPSYTFPAWSFTNIAAESPVPVGWWRSVGHSNTVFATEYFLDELALAGGQDPYQLRRMLLDGNDRLLAVLDLAATQAGWGSPNSEGWFRGIAACQYDQTCVAMVAFVSVAPDGAVRVHKAVCAIDCGLVVNPSTVEAQIEGAVAFGSSAALKGEITFTDGLPDQSNFDDYPILRMNEMPVVEVHFVPSDAAPLGVGEPMVPVVAPAIANAVLAATGQPIRKLPIRLTDDIAR